MAALDVGSNTVHLLVATPRGDRLRDAFHAVTMPRVAREVANTGRVGADKLAEVVADVERLAQLAKDRHAETLLVCATEAVRRAADRDEVLRAVSAAAGSRCALISEEVEALLSFRGAITEHHNGGLSLVADIGGASTECILGERGVVHALASIAIGSGVATERWLRDDPATPQQRAACAAEARALVGEAPPGAPRRGIVTGGTATTMPRLLGRDEAGHLDRADIVRCRNILDAAPSAEVAAAHGIEPARARVLAGGVEIVAAVLERYALERVTVSQAGLRDGMILAYLEKGDRWIDG